MSVYRVTIGMYMANIGATETYYSQDRSNIQIGGDVTRLLTRRAALFTKDVKFAGVRVGTAEDKRRSAFYPPGRYTLAADGIALTVPVEGTAPDEIAFTPDQARSVLQVRLTYATDRHAMRYLSFIPDEVILAEPRNPNLAFDVRYQVRWEAFVRELVANPAWQIRARDSTTTRPEFEIVRWTKEPGETGLLGVLVKKTDVTTIVQGDKVSIKNARRMAQFRVSYNGIYKVDRVDTTTDSANNIYYLQTTGEGDPTTIKKNGTIQKVTLRFFNIQGVTVVRPGIHKRGKPLGVPRGRRSTRLPLDP